MCIEIKKNFKSNDKIYFDVTIDKKITINHCFLEEGDFGDMLLRLPTKQTPKGVFQSVWFEDQDLFKEIQDKAREEL